MARFDDLTNSRRTAAQQNEEQKAAYVHALDAIEAALYRSDVPENGVLWKAHGEAPHNFKTRLSNEAKPSVTPEQAIGTQSLDPCVVTVAVRSEQDECWTITVKVGYAIGPKGVSVWNAVTDEHIGAVKPGAEAESADEIASRMLDWMLKRGPLT